MRSLITQKERARKSQPQPLQALSVAVYNPVVVYVCTGFRKVELIPSPKCHK